MTIRRITKFVCQQCSYQSPSYLGRCPNCSAWNSLVETVEESQIANRPTSSRLRGASKSQGKAAKPLRVSEIRVEHMARISTGMEEFDRVLGSGILKGAVTLLSGDPGIGKSTLLLHLALHLTEEGKTVCYVSGEESVEQIKLRIDRLSEKYNTLKLNNFYLLAETNVENILDTVASIQPDIFIIDSIQTMATETLTGMAGSVGQVRQSTLAFLTYAKGNALPLFLVGHVTKEGAIAGPQVLSHIVDTVLFFEGERYQSLRLLRGIKNRFGPVDEVGIFEMMESGLEEMSDPNKLFVSQGKLPGKAIVLTLEGTRPFLCEIQALVVPTKLAFPKRVVSGLDSRRVELMIAVLQKTLRLPLERFDIFVSTTAGLKVFEPALDLGIVLAIVSSFKNKAMKDAVAIAEVSLLGELKPVSQMERRIKEGKRLGFTMVVSQKTFSSLGEVVRKVLP